MRCQQSTDRARAPLAAGDPATMVAAGQQNIFYRSVGGAISRIWFDEALYYEKWTSKVGAPPAAGDPATMVIL